MRDLNDIQIFAAVADLHGFEAAARKLGLSVSTVSRRIAALERRLGLALIQRTTRSVRLTSAGETYRAYCTPVLAAAAQAEEALAQHRAELRGDLCVNAPILFGQRILTGVVAAFAAAHPGIRVHMELTNARVDPVETGCDLVVRTGSLKDSSLKVQRLAEAHGVVVGSPGLIAIHGAPDDWSALAKKPCLVFGKAREGRWHLPCAPAEAHTVKAALTANDLEAIRGAAIAGAGFAVLPRFAVRDALDDGRLVAVPPAVSPTPVHAIFPHHPVPNIAARKLARTLSNHLAASSDWISRPR